MYPVTESYKRAAEGAVRRESVGGSLTLEDGTVLPLTAGDLLSGSLCIDNQCVSGQELEFGCVYLGQARFRLRTAVSRYRLYGAAVALEYSIETDEGPFTLPLGRFTVAEAERSGAAVSLTCYDAVLALTKAYTGPAVQGTPWQMLDQIAAACGLALAQTEEELQDWPNAGHIFQLSPADGCETWRDCAAAVAQVLGAFVTADRSGALAVRRFAGQACRSVGPSARCEAKVSDFTCHYCGVTAAELGAFAEDDTGLTLAFEDAPLLEQGVSAFRQQLLDALLPVVTGCDYTPAELTLPGDPALDCGDRIALPDHGAELLLTHTNWTFRGRHTVKGVGRNPYVAGASGRDQRLLQRLRTGESRSRTVYYTFLNTRPVDVADGAESRLAEVRFVTAEPTTALFLAQLMVTADADTTLTVQYFLDQVPVETCRPRFTLAPGPHTAALVYPLTDLEGGRVHVLTLRLSAAGGAVHLDTGGLRGVVSGQGLGETSVWTGLLEGEDLLPCLPLPAAGPRVLRSLTDEAAYRFRTPVGAAPADPLGALALGGGLRLGGTLLDAVQAGQVLEHWTADADYNTPFFETPWVVPRQDGGFGLRTRWTFAAVPEPVDAGLLQVLHIDRSVLPSDITALEVNAQ